MSRLNIQEAFVAERRLTILRILLEVREAVPDVAMMHALHATARRVKVDREAVREDYKFLEELMCVTTDLVDDRVLEATITSRGALAAQGNIKIPGVADALLER